MNEKSKTFEEVIAKAFSMSDKTWEKHANPLSVYTRYSVLPILILAFWSRVWFGRWSIICIVLALFWVWLNPRFFNKPKSTNNWASKAVMGERVWLNRKKIPVPEHHKILPNILSVVSSAGMILCIFGIITLQNNGIIVYDGSDFLTVPFETIVEKNYLGAEDAFLGGFLSGYLKQHALVDCATLGSSIASIVLEQSCISFKYDLDQVPLRKELIRDKVEVR